MTINASTAILAALCLVLACVSIALAFLLLRRRTQACEKQSHFTNFDRLTGLGNKAKLLADDAAIESLDSYALVSVHLNRYMELYNLFGVTVSDGLITSLSHALVTFAEDRDGIAYRVAFDHLVMLVRVKDKPAFLDILKCFMQKSERMDIELAGTHYIYNFLLLYGVYFLSEENDKGIGLPNILIFLDRKVLHSTLKSAAQCAVMDGADKPDWKIAEVLAQDARASWEKHEFVPYYQPIFNIYTGKVVGSEILARWQHPSYGLLLPHQFVPILERNGLIMDLDLYMIEEACKKIQYWLDNGILTVPLAINLSALNVHRTDFVDRLINLVTKYNIPPVLLELELPERNLLYEDNEDFIGLMNFLHKKGFTLSMGHFAETDVSSLWLLRKLPLDTIKVDYHFFENPTNSERTTLYVQNFLELTTLLNIKVVVTQLETPEQVRVVQDFGCTNGKGFCLSKPLSGEEFQEFIR